MLVQLHCYPVWYQPATVSIVPQRLSSTPSLIHVQPGITRSCITSHLCRVLPLTIHSIYIYTDIDNQQHDFRLEFRSSLRVLSNCLLVSVQLQRAHLILQSVTTMIISRNSVRPSTNYSVSSPNIICGRTVGDARPATAVRAF